MRRTLMIALCFVSGACGGSDPPADNFGMRPISPEPIVTNDGGDGVDSSAVDGTVVGNDSGTGTTDSGVEDSNVPPDSGVDSSVGLDSGSDSGADSSSGTYLTACSNDNQCTAPESCVNVQGVGHSICTHTCNGNDPCGAGAPAGCGPCAAPGTCGVTGWCQ